MSTHPPAADLWYTVALAASRCVGVRRRALPRAAPVRASRGARPAARARGATSPAAGSASPTAGARAASSRRRLDPPLDPGIAAYFEASATTCSSSTRRAASSTLSDPSRALTVRRPRAARRARSTPPPTGRPARHVAAAGESGRDVRAIARPLGTAAGPDQRRPGGRAHRPRSRSVPAVLLRSMLLIAPLVLLGVGLRRATGSPAASLRPVEGMMDELEAITDGRSLHRRLAVPLAGDELARLAQTLNRMLARLEQSFVEPAPVHRRREPRAQDPADGAPGRGGARAHRIRGTPPEVLESLDETLGEINRMTELVESLLTLARADEGRAPLAGGADATCASWWPRRRRRRGCWPSRPAHGRDARCPTQPVLGAVDRQPDPAAAAQPGDQRDQVHPAGRQGRARAGGRRATASRIIVGDTGIGIAAGDLPHIFDRFWRADPARSRTGERPGSGLGLAITKWIAEAHGGSISRAEPAGAGNHASPSSLPLAGACDPERQLKCRDSDTRPIWSLRANL